MMSQRDAGASKEEQSSLNYGRYEGEQEYTHQRNEASEGQLRREGPGEKIYLPPRDNTNLFRFLTFVIAMVALLAFVFVCLIIVGGAGGWISFCAASLAILTIASTLISVSGKAEK